MTTENSWRAWTYSDWNERLVDYYFRSIGAPVADYVERIPATPEELVEIVVEPADATERPDPTEVAEAFVSRILEQMPYAEIAFCGFCRDYGGWTPGSARPPHFFAALWLTCLVSYGYPDEGGGFHERMRELFDRRQNFDCLPQLWRDLERWTEIRRTITTSGARAGILRELVLPPPDDYRSTVGFSWFLAFPHERDRRRLREILSTEDLAGEEPPLMPTVAALVRHRYQFAGSFREDLENFVAAFVNTGADARESAFWRAVRREALAPAGHGGAGDATVRVELHARFDDNEDLRPYLACTADVALPPGFYSHPLADEPGSPTHYVTVGASDDPEGIDRAVEAALRGEAVGAEAARHARRGVLVFQEVLTGVYQLAGGSEANEADVALVREELVEHFLRAFGGSDDPSRFPGWRQVTGCEVAVRRDPPQGMERVLHVQETMVPPSVRLVGGVRATEGFLALPNFLPKIKFRGADRVEVLDVRGEPATSPCRDRSDTDLWHLPRSSANRAPISLTVRVRWRDADDRPRISETELVFVDRQMDCAYKPLGAGRYYVEGSTPGQAETSGGEEIPLGVTDRALGDAADIPELAALDPTVRYLGPNVGELSLTPRPGFDWLAIGPKNRPTALLFVGNPAAPAGRPGGSCRDAGARRHWRAAIRCPRVAVRTPRGRVEAVGEYPEVEETLRRYRSAGIYTGASAPVATAHCRSSEFPPTWSGVLPDPRVAEVVDALAALAVRKSGVRYRELFDLLSTVIGVRTPIRPATLHELIRAWAEAGLVDVVYSQGRPATYVSARRPRFVAYAVGGVVRAALVGLVPHTLEDVVARTVRAGGGRCAYSRPPCPWLPSTLRVECDVPSSLSDVSSELGLDTPRWLSWPGGPGDRDADLRPEVQSLDGTPHDSYRVESSWVPGFPRFVRSLSADAEMPRHADLLVEKRTHRERVPVYALLVDGEPLAHARIRNWVILLAYSLGDAPPPFRARASGPIVRPGHAGGVYMPLPVGRLCAVLGEGLAGPVLAGDDVTVEEYVYPLGAAYRRDIADWIPLLDDGHDEGNGSMQDPIGNFLRIRELYLSYLDTAFRIGDENVAEERRRLLREPGTLCTEPLVEPLPRYESYGLAFQDLVEPGDPRSDPLAGFDPEARRAFVELVLAGLVPSAPRGSGEDAPTTRVGGYAPYTHQIRMLQRGAREGTPGIVTSGTGSGKTEAFLLPLFAALAREARGWSRPEEGYLGSRWWQDPATGSPYRKRNRRTGDLEVGYEGIPSDRRPTKRYPGRNPFRSHRAGETRDAAFARSCCIP